MRETKSARLTRMHDEYDILRQVIPAPACALHFSNPLELLIATVLSAQTTDKRVNTVTPELFATYPTARDLAAANAFDIPGFPVDTHVMRVTGRLRWRSDWRSAHPDPVKIEKEITSCFPPEEWTNLSHRLILFGRATCHARTPDCANCPLSDTCPSYAPPAGKSTSKR